jgi:hypothetical protein
MKSLMPGASALADKLTAELYTDHALIPASPWLGSSRPAAPRGRVVRDASSNEQLLRIVPGARARWITVQVLRNGSWQQWVLPASYTQLVIGNAQAAPADAVVVTAIDRNGVASIATPVAPAPRVGASRSNGGVR